MGNLVSILLWLLLGAALSLPYLAVGRRLDGPRARQWWATGLVVAALIYVGFAFLRSAPASAILFEMGGVVVYGAIAALGVRGDPRWLGVAWLLRPLWDLGLHGPGGFALAPQWYVWACLSFDVVVAATLWIAFSRQTGGASEALVR